MAKVYEIRREGKLIMYAFHCPGCKWDHMINVDPEYHKSVWEFNRDMERPTVSPSILVRTPQHNKPDRICHSFVKEGKIQYLSDCTHELAGQTIDMVDVDVKKT